MEPKMKLLNEWIEKLVFPGKVSDFVKITKKFKVNDIDHLEFVFFTDEYKYKILAIDRKSDNGYLGCQVSARKTRAGEDWHRGNDLPDGNFTLGTWNIILNSIINYELVELSKFQQPNYTPNQ